MPKLQSTHPDTLKPFMFHGVNLSWQDGDKQATGDCPFCGREGHFGVEIATSKFSCFLCGESGNSRSFIRRLWGQSDKDTTDYQTLAEVRKLLYPDTVMHWGLAKSIITGDWLVPAYDAKGHLSQLYRYVKTPDRMHLLATPTFKHGLCGVNLYDKSKSTICLCEGVWDAMALWEILGHAKLINTEEYLGPTTNPNRCLLADINVLAVPGCNVFLKAWSILFAGKVVNLMFDNDYPRKHPKTDKAIDPAGLCGMRRVTRILKGSTKPPAEINWLRWGEGGYSPELPDGHDVRDSLCQTPL